MKFVKKPVVIEARQLSPEVAEDTQEIIALAKWCNGGVNYSVNNDRQKRTIIISTLEGVMTAKVGDWIIKGVSGEFYPCKPDIFELTYEEVK